MAPAIGPGPQPPRHVWAAKHRAANVTRRYIPGTPKQLAVTVDHPEHNGPWVMLCYFALDNLDGVGSKNVVIVKEYEIISSGDAHSLVA